jgi:hypothetical protein
MTTFSEPGHEPRIKRYPNSSNAYRSAWFCSCGMKAKALSHSEPTALMDYYRAHLPNHPEPPHYLTVVPGEMYADTWKCSCGEVGEPAGYVNDRRLRQSHTSHYEALVVEERLHWTYDQRGQHARIVRDEEAARNAAERAAQMERVMVERQRLIQERLDELL